MPTGEPLYLPRGSVRALLCLGVVGVTLGMWAGGQKVSPEQLTMASAALSYYIGARNGEGGK